MKYDEEEILVAAFQEQIRDERELEELKLKLASQHDFNLMTAFQILDRENRGFLTGPDLLNSLENLGENPSKDSVYLFLRRYDMDSDGRLLYSDFCDVFSPKDSQVCAQLSHRTTC